VLIEPGGVVLVEEPSYLTALQAFKLAGATVVPVPCDDDGQVRDVAKLASELGLEQRLGGEDRRGRR
jgi:DNA-binding transcriptional MocR family regulator